MKAYQIISELKIKGYTKWQIKKLIGVSWRTVRQWETQKTIPNKENMEKLENLFRGGYNE